MNKLLSKIWQQSPIVFNHGLRTFILGLGNMVIAVLAIQRISADFWGSFVPYLLWMGVGLHIVSWGNKEYLLRSFSNRPEQEGEEFYRVLCSRLLLLGCFCISGLLVFPNPTGLALALWLLVYFLYQSLDALITFRQAFGQACIADVVGLAILIGAIIFFPESLDIRSLALLYALSFLVRTIVLLVFLKVPSYRIQDSYFDFGYYAIALPFLIISLIGMLSSRVDLYTATAVLSKEQIAQYQIITASLGYVRAAAGILVYSFIKQVYQLSWTASKLWLYRLIALGGLISIVGSLGLYLLTNWYMGMQLPDSLFLLAIWYVWPAFAITLCVIRLFKLGKERTVIYLSLLNLSINLILSLILFPPLGLQGGLIAGAIGTTVIAGLHLYLFQKGSSLLNQVGEK
ncbi:MAG: hypothetical protein AAFZ63_14970 [Bacteroidota bacterium]